jgi:hypothetical protein
VNVASNVAHISLETDVDAYVSSFQYSALVNVISSRDSEMTCWQAKAFLEPIQVPGSGICRPNRRQRSRQTDALPQSVRVVLSASKRFCFPKTALIWIRLVDTYPPTVVLILRSRSRTGPLRWTAWRRAYQFGHLCLLLWMDPKSRHKAPPGRPYRHLQKLSRPPASHIGNSRPARPRLGQRSPPDHT